MEGEEKELEEARDLDPSPVCSRTAIWVRTSIVSYTKAHTHVLVYKCPCAQACTTCIREHQHTRMLREHAAYTGTGNVTCLCAHNPTLPVSPTVTQP